jgi:hypothetical protein
LLKRVKRIIIFALEEKYIEIYTKNICAYFLLSKNGKGIRGSF